jgi:hypothetical protein
VTDELSTNVAEFVDQNDTTAADTAGTIVSERDTGSNFEPLRVHARPLVLIDPDVAVLEWVKHALHKNFKQVHVFQQADQGLMRIRQYLIRGELPVVLISPDAEIDPLSGICGLSDFVKRLKSQAARLPVFGLIEAEVPPSVPPQSHLDGMLSRPGRKRLRDSSGEFSQPATESLFRALDRFLTV